jgi:hypothetical protein
VTHNDNNTSTSDKKKKKKKKFKKRQKKMWGVAGLHGQGIIDWIYPSAFKMWEAMVKSKGMIIFSHI